MAAISRDDVAHLAKLARIEMTPAELDHMATELEQILGAVKRVQEVATTDIAPTSHPLSMSNVFRDDVVKPSLTNSEALSGAPAKADERFKVPQILGEE
ncbi:GatC Asp-tRNAAsn/Glu-tRNAGln amidotransferase C subunit [actinobacterium SCGC AAA044-D11]